MNTDFNVEKPHSNVPEELQKLKYTLLELNSKIADFRKNEKNFTRQDRQKNISDFLKEIERKYKILTENNGILEIINSYEEIRNFNNLFIQEKRELEYILMKINLDEVNKIAKEAAMSIKKSQENLEDTKKEVNKIKLSSGKTLKEAENTKKDLISIMGLFLGIFMFFQLNFSQMNDLTNYDPFNRIVYLILFNMIFLLGIYLIFVLIDYIVHKKPRMLKIFYDIEKKKIIKNGWIFIFIYVGILLFGSYQLKDDFGIKRIVKIEENVAEIIEDVEKYINEIEKLNLDYKELAKKISDNALQNNDINAKTKEELLKKLKELEIQIKNLEYKLTNKKEEKVV